MSCKYCTEYEDLPEHIVNGDPFGRVFDTCIQRNENGWHIEVPSGCDIGIRFCPYCGEKLRYVFCDRFSCDCSRECHDCGCWMCQWNSDCDVCENKESCENAHQDGSERKE